MKSRAFQWYLKSLFNSFTRSVAKLKFDLFQQNWISGFCVQNFDHFEIWKQERVYQHVLYFNHEWIKKQSPSRFFNFRSWSSFFILSSLVMIPFKKRMGTFVLIASVAFRGETNLVFLSQSLKNLFKMIKCWFSKVTAFRTLCLTSISSFGILPFLCVRL